MFYIKAVGLILIFSVCSMIGFLKAFTLKKRRDRLICLIKCMTSLSEYVKIGNSERKSLIERSFGDEFSIEKNTVKEDDLTKEDKELFAEFFKSFGKSEKRAEFDKINLYLNFLKENLKKAENDFEKLSKLYSRTGVLIGLVICIFLI